MDLLTWLLHMSASKCLLDAAIFRRGINFGVCYDISFPIFFLGTIVSSKITHII